VSAIASAQLAELPPFEITGPPCAPVVVALGGISATRHVAASDDDPERGWWEDVVGPGRAVDTSCYRVLGFDFLDGGVADDGGPARTVTTHDQADALARLLDALDVDAAHAVIGASYGGMVALAFAERYPRRLRRLVAISAPHQPHPMTTAVRSVQRGIVRLGLETGRPREALSLARALAMTTYRTPREFGERFAPEPTDVARGTARFPVESYLRHHGDRFAAAWSPARLLALSLSADLHRVDPTRITVPTLVVAAEGDAIVPRAQLEALAAAIDAPTRLADVATTTGHDAFLTEPRHIGSLIEAALEAPELP
jgi:homoserine O-acetyltransferase